MSNLTPITHQGQRILLTAQLAESYGTDAKHINDNFSNNKDRYTLGKHYFLLEGEELKAFKEAYPIFSGNLKYAPVVQLWTEKGAWLHAKSLNTDKAWEAYEMLVDEYYRVKDLPMDQSKRRISSRVKPAIKDAFDTAEYLKEKLGISIGIAQAACIRAVEKNSGLDLTEIAKCLPAAEHETGYLNATEIGKRLGIGAVQANKLLLAKGLQEQQLDAKGNKRWRITDAGKQYGEEFPYVRNGHSDYQIRWNESVMEALKEPEEKMQTGEDEATQ